MRRVLLDTNVVISALLFPDSVPAQALAMVLAQDQLVLTSWIIDELHEVVERATRPGVRAEHLLASIDYDLVEPFEPGGGLFDDDLDGVADRLDADAGVSSLCTDVKVVPLPEMGSSR